jgi:Pyrimidine dimer DNA glycosylase
MRLWSLHPKYLDSKGLVAAWREALLASAVLQNLTKGYRNHPQLNRFKESVAPVIAIAIFLKEIYIESKQRGYNFNASKIPKVNSIIKLQVTNGQLKYEWDLLRTKLAKRDPEKLSQIKEIDFPEPHPLFEVVNGKIEKWEKVKEM